MKANHGFILGGRSTALEWVLENFSLVLQTLYLIILNAI